MVVNRNGHILQLASDAGNAMSSAMAPSTRKKYDAGWKRYEQWCRQHLPDQSKSSSRTVILYLTDRSRTTSLSSLGLDLAAIRYHLALAGTPLEDRAQDLRRFRKGIARGKTEVPNSKSPITPELLSRMLSLLPSSIKGKRDRAMLLFGFSAALRRSELVQLQWREVRFEDRYLRFGISASKTSVNSTTRTIPRLKNAFCPWQAMKTWKDEIGREATFCFCRLSRGRTINAPVSDRYVARLVKRLLRDSGENPEDYGGHSLRSGFASAAYWSGVHEQDIRKVTQHRSKQGLEPYLHARPNDPHFEIFKVFGIEEENE
ncbi:tyrosine-type recombinase/integrase [Thalassospira tepidiphila]|uniref:tyrosine-type recombinase/integrase n=1 Tax=Thalassospira tepidiphila TaxID=393657 RepID=UPI0030C71050